VISDNLYIRVDVKMVYWYVYSNIGVLFKGVTLHHIKSKLINPEKCQLMLARAIHDAIKKQTNTKTRKKYCRYAAKQKRNKIVNHATRN